jgi:septum formation protein
MKSLILASQSPRRQQLLKDAGFIFDTVASDVDETIPKSIKAAEAPEYLAKLKAITIHELYPSNDIIAADTIVILGDKILGKPMHALEAKEMLTQLSGNSHQVITGVCIINNRNVNTFSSITTVYFKKLTEAQIDFYIENYKPFDKAGSYAIQEWIGMVGIEKIEGDYYNVMGLPIHKVVEVLSK